MNIPETFPPELCCTPSPAWDEERPHARQSNSYPTLNLKVKGEASALTKDVIKPGIVLKRVMRDFPVLLSSPKERVEAVVRVHGDIEVWAECAWCNRCLACFWGNI